ncbi:uncharacterized protein LODBEIA_P03140 [Lodderomyces beijingensis]|uniref:Sphingoid long-chain base transporter RSB1 n=1 Tax=Lodderomyces beijingensis TaxID=1775926 RepID=A0ABP0ZID3_9ASCO
MESLINEYLPSWTPTVSPTTTSISSIDPTNTQGLFFTALQLQAELRTQTNSIQLYLLLQKAKGAAATYTLLNNQRILSAASAASATAAAAATATTATTTTGFGFFAPAAAATATQDLDLAEITQQSLNATLCLKDLEWGQNLYAIYISVPFNVLFAALFLLVLLVNINLGCIWGKSKYFTVCFICGTLLEILGYSVRTAARYYWSNSILFVIQQIALTLAPAFIMAGIYYVLAQLAVLYGPRFSILRPTFISYLFICCDVISLVIQAAGGAVAAVAMLSFENTHPGTYLMVGGIAFQVVSMTVFLWFVFDFIYRINFKFNESLRFSFGRWLNLFFNTKSGKLLREEHYFEALYNPDFSHIRSRPLFNYMPLALVVASAFIYVRCIYRVVELSQGWRGYLITHEAFLLTMDALMVLLCCLVMIPFHPSIVLGRFATKDIKLDTKNETDTEGHNQVKKENHRHDHQQEKVLYFEKFPSRKAHNPPRGNFDEKKHVYDNESEVSSGSFVFNDTYPVTKNYQKENQKHHSHQGIHEYRNFTNQQDHKYNSSHYEERRSVSDDTATFSKTTKTSTTARNSAASPTNSAQRYSNPYLTPTRFSSFK